MKTSLPILSALVLLGAAPAFDTEDTGAPPRLTEDHVRDLRWRNIGPAAMGGRIIDLAFHPTRRQVFYAASATGGLFKTTNNGTTFSAVFENEGSSSVGAVAIAPSAPETVWVGTGEANPRNSVSWGNGAYRSDDGGESWVHTGLELTRHIGGIAICPDDPRTVFVGAMGSTWGESADRGLYRTQDAGETWEQVLFVNERTGCIDVRIDPEHPEVVYTATYERQRDEFDSNDPAVRTGPGSGIWRSLDGGDSWERLRNGLPTVALGRIGIDVYGADPRVLYCIIETERTGERGAPPRAEDRVSLGIRGRDAEEGEGFSVDSVTPGESAAQAGLEAGDVITNIDGKPVDGRSALVEALADYGPGDSAQLVFLRAGAEETASLELLGKLLRSRARSFAGSQGGQVENAQGEQGEDGFESGGVFRSDDRGTTWTRINSLNPRPFYYSQIRVDPSDESRMYVLGISLHRSTDGGERFETVGRDVHPDHHSMWIDPTDSTHVVLGNDGGVYSTWDDALTWDHHDVLTICQFYGIAVDDRTPYWVYGGLQDNGSWGGPSATRGRGIATSDWIKIGGGDGFRCAVDPTNSAIVYSESQNGAISRLDMTTGERVRISPSERGARFNWNTPFLLSPHNASLFYYAGDAVFRSIDGGRTSARISDTITRTERGSATALTQSPFDEDLLFVGTDDGALWRTRDGGSEWEDLSKALPGIDVPLYVSDIEPSPHSSDTIYLTLDGHRSNDFAPYVFVSDDRGDSWRLVTQGLPDASVRTIALDPRSPSLAFVGTEVGCFVSIDAGENWTPFMSGLPTVPVHDLVIQARESDLVAGTHGRGIWIADIAPLEALDSDVLAGGPFLFPVQPARIWSNPPQTETSGSRRWIGENPARGAAIYYYLPEGREGPVSLTVRDATGRSLRSLEGPGEAGLHVVRWDLRPGRERQGGGARGGTTARGRANAGRAGGAGGAQGGGGGGFGRRGGTVEVGDYSVTLELGEEPTVRAMRVLPDPVLAPNVSGPTR